MNKKKIFLTLGLVLVIAFIAGAVIFKVKSDRDNEKKDSSSALQKDIKSCSLFSLDEAKEIFGDNISEDPKNNTQGSAIPPSDLAEAPGVETKVSTCGYFEGEVVSQNISEQSPEPNSQPVAENPKPSEKNSKPVSSKNAPAPPELGGQTDNNEKQPSGPILKALVVLRTTTAEQAAKDFDSSKPKQSEDVPNLGQKAYWAEGKTASGDKVGQLSILSNGYTIIVSGQEMDLETAKKVAEVVLNKL